MKENNTLYLVDVSSFFFRAFYAVRELNTSKGFPTNALYGFLSMTIKIIREFDPKYMAYCLDQKEPSFRKEFFSEYKANRTQMPEELEKQIPYIHKITKILGIPQIEKKNYEADDVIGSLAKWGEANGMNVVIVSGDKDFAQLINSTISMYDPSKKKTFTPEVVFEKWGVTPEQFIDYQSLVGDVSDNIPGAKGIGAKSAEKLLEEYKTLEGIYAHIEEIKGAKHKRLSESKENVELSKRLVRIVTDLDLVEDLSDLELKEKNQEELKEIFEFLEFDSFLKHFQKSNPGEVKNSVLIDCPKAKNFISKAQEVPEVHFVQTDWGERALLGDHVCSLPLEEEELLKIGVWIKKEKKIISGFDLKFFLKKLGITQLGTEVSMGEDLQLMCYAALSEPWAFKKAAQFFLEESDVSDFNLLESYQELLKKVPAYFNEKTSTLYYQVEKPILELLLKMEHLGVFLDMEQLDRHSKEIAERLKELTQSIHEMAGKEFNIASTKQLAKVLFEDLKLTPIKKTKTGFSTNTEVLEKLKKDHPICEQLIEFRSLSKLKSNFVDAISKLVSPKTGRVHTTYNQALTTTGRLSSAHPNLQNIPVRTEEGKKVRKAFIPKPGHVFVSADYSQIELRILAHFCQDKALLEAFFKGHDVHKKTASEIFEVPLDEVTSSQRGVGKAVNFGIAYGQGVYGLSETLGVPRVEAKKIIESYFEKFEGVKRYIDTSIEEAKVHFKSETLLGRVRLIHELKTENKMTQKFGERVAINTPIQGTAADFIKLAMIEVQNKLSLDLLMQVHDELIFEVPKEQAQEQAQEIKAIMESVYPLSVPLVVNVSIGENWEEAH